MITLHRLSSLMMLLALIGGTTACSSQRQTYVPDGRRGYVINCGGLMSKASSCLVKAGRACGNRGYDVIKGTEEDGSVLIACKVPPIPPPPELARH